MSLMIPLNCMLGETINALDYLSQLYLNIVTVGQKLPDSRCTTQYFRTTKLCYRGVFMNSRCTVKRKEFKNTMFPFKKKKKSKYIKIDSFVKKKVQEDTLGFSNSYL